MVALVRSENHLHDAVFIDGLVQTDGFGTWRADGDEPIRGVCVVVNCEKSAAGRLLGRGGAGPGSLDGQPGIVGQCWYHTEAGGDEAGGDEVAQHGNSTMARRSGEVDHDQAAATPWQCDWWSQHRQSRETEK